MTLYHINNSFINGYMPYILNVISLIIIISSILVITSNNPIISILYLITLFFSIATYLILIGITFIGISYLLVYVGAVSILFIFILMLLNVRASELTTKTRNSIPLGVIIVILFSYPLYYILPNNIINQYISSLFSYNTGLYQTVISPSFNYNLSNINVNSVSFVTSKSWDATIAETSHITSIGNILYTNYSIWLIITSIILLLAMVGSIVITVNPQDHLSNKDFYNDNSASTLNNTRPE